MDVILAALEALERRSEQQQVAAPPPPRPAPRPQPAAPAPAPAQQQADLVQAHYASSCAAGLLQGLFEDGNSLLRAVVAAEVLQPPLALREPALWTQQPNEPSI